MEFVDLISQFGEIGAFSALALFFVWYFIRAVERAQERHQTDNDRNRELIERVTARFAESNESTTQALMELRIELERLRRSNE